MRKVILSLVLSVSFLSAPPAVCHTTAEVLANSRRIESYRAAVYFAAILSVFDMVLGAIWANENERLPNAAPADQKGRAQTIYSVSIASTAVAGLAAITAGSLAIRATHESWILDMHHDHWRHWVAFREYFTPFVLLVQAGLQTWAGVEISRVPGIPERTEKWFWGVTGFMIASFTAGVFVPITGGMLTRHRPFK